MKGYAMLKIGESGWIEKDRPQCGPMDAICRPLCVDVGEDPTGGDGGND